MDPYYWQYSSTSRLYSIIVNPLFYFEEDEMMHIVTSGDEFDTQSERFDDDYCQSADISESETSSNTNTFTCRPNAAYSSSSSSSSSSPLDFASNGSSNSYRFKLPPPVMLPVIRGQHVFLEEVHIGGGSTADLSDVELMKERFSKLLLGEDMSGGGKGVCTALAISNAITNLAASVFGDVWKLEALSPEMKIVWDREIDWLLSVSDSIVELIPSVQQFPDGESYEVMVTQQRSDLYINLPALKKLDTILINILDGFSSSEFCYVDRGVLLSKGGEHIEAEYSPSSSSGISSVRVEEKCWLPFPKVPVNGLPDSTRKQLQQCRECTNQIYKAALAINSNVLSEMEVPKVYLANLPKSGKACLGDVLYRYITAEEFSPESLVDYLELSSEYTTLEIANRIEDVVLVWKQKIRKNRSSRHFSPGKSSWGVAVKGLLSTDVEKNKLLAERAETLLMSLKLHFPGLPQSNLDINKIKYNEDVGHSILESYSRVIQSLAFNLMSRIDELLYVDEATRRRATSKMLFTAGGEGSTEISTLQKQAVQHHPSTSSEENEADHIHVCQ